MPINLLRYLGTYFSNNFITVILVHKQWPEGAFILRPRPDQFDQVVISVLYRTVPTHHLVAQNPEGVFTVNGKAFGYPVKSIDEVGM